MQLSDRRIVPDFLLVLGVDCPDGADNDTVGRSTGRGARRPGQVRGDVIGVQLNNVVASCYGSVTCSGNTRLSRRQLEQC